MKEFFKYLLATFCGLVMFLIFNMFLTFMMLGAALALSEPAETIVEEHSIYKLELKGTVVEHSEDDPFEAALYEVLGQDMETIYGLNDILANIKKAKENPNIEGIYLKGGSLVCGITTAQEIRDALLDFKQSGKFIIAYADQYTQSNYYIASVADQMCLNASGSLSWHGLGSTLTFFSRFLDKVGVSMQVVKVGTFKSAVEPYIRTEMSEANRLQYATLLNDCWTKIKADVAQSRHIDVDSLNHYADLCMIVQPQETYVQTGLVDSLCYVQDLENVLTHLVGTCNWHVLEHAEMKAVADHKTISDNKVAVLYAEGEITDNSGDGIVGKTFVKEINDLREDDDVKAVVLRVNSPGGSAYASEQIHHALLLLQEEKLLIVSMGDYAASGGYYISCLADYIYAEPTTLTGSIGIFGLIPNVAGLTDKLGFDFDTIATNKHANFESNMIFYGMNSEETMMMQAEINRGYELFTRRCAEGRDMPQDSIKAIGEGRVWSGVRALQLGLVDELGSLNDAIEKAALMADIVDYTIAEYPEPEDKMTKLLSAFSASVRLDKQLEKQLGKENYQTYMYLRSLTEKPSVQARLPYVLNIQ